MKKTKIIISIVTMFAIICLSTIANAATIKGTTTYGAVDSDGMVPVTVTFTDDMSDGVQTKAQEAGWTVDNSKKLSIKLKEGAFNYFSKTEGEDTTEVLACAPIILKTNEIRTFSDDVTIISSANTNVVKYEDGKLKPVGEGETTITGKTTTNKGNEISLTWNVKVIKADENPGNENPGNENPGNENPGNENPGNENPGNENPGNENPGNENQGNENQGNENQESEKINHKWTDGSKVKVTLDEKSNLNINYLNTNIKKVGDSKSTYTIYISKNANENVTLNSIKENKTTLYASKEGEFLSATIHSKLLELSGDTYAYIIEKCNDYKSADYNKEKVIVKGQKLETVKLPTYGNRLDMWFYSSDKFNGISNKIYATKTRKLTYKIGKIDSNEVLSAFKNKSTNEAYEELYKYAKQAKILKEGTYNLDDIGGANPLSDIDIENDGYYFVYMSLDNENGTYIDIDDVAIYRASTVNGNSMYHFAFNTIQVDDKKDEGKDAGKTEEKNDGKSEEKLPQTGATSTMAIITATAMAIGAAGFIGYRKYNGIK